MSRNNTLVPLTAALLVVSGAVAGYTGYTYVTDTKADTFYLSQLGDLRSAAMQTVFIAEKAATNSEYIPELENAESIVDQSMAKLRSGDSSLSISGLPSSAMATLNNFDSVWSEITPSLSAIISSKASTEAFTRSSQEASREIVHSLSLVEAAVARATANPAVSDALKQQLNDAVVSLKQGTGSVASGQMLALESLQESAVAITHFLGSMTTIGNALPRDNSILEPLLHSYRASQNAQRAVGRAVDSSSNAVENLPHAKEIFAKRDRLNAALSSLKAGVSILPQARPITPAVVGIAGLVMIALSLIAFFVMLRTASSRERTAETKGMNIEVSQSNKSKEHLLLLKELRRVEGGDLTTPLTEDNESTRETSKALNSVFASLRSILNEANITAVSLAAAAEQTSHTAKNVDRNRGEQFKAIEHINDRIASMLGFIDIIEKMTKQSNTISYEVSNKVQSGTDFVNKVHEGIVVLNQHNTGIQHQSKHLLESFQSLERMAEVVKEVAQKSDYVSWNAYLIVENITDQSVAARVSKSAEAMNALSQESKVAFAEITTLLKTMNDAARDTQHVVETSRVEIESLLKRSMVAQDALTSIQDMTGELNKNVELVSERTQELKSQSSEVSSTMKTITHYATENSAASEQTATAVSNVNKTAQLLLKLIEPYTISR
ncbi:methyl-accepting chemotaxis protein (plasmid) [Halopseudomonas sp. SMJS2]|uniref:methyl-accepting chemotaxis protein n=1 Tax=Halopseudomonas sp. SMJS2 TaxID=3041098 RepID=UPI002453147A|nr:methyl-accepting chemotaxis protein [Halopseudomonas sp. SMJS2]WGK63386.1 methyl-accepting chemotaxis protein [Halopseudomonas sp. SMJS2]